MTRVDTKRWQVVTLAGWLGALLGCAPPQTFDHALRGEIELDDGDLAAVAALLDASPHGPEDLRLLRTDDSPYGTEPLARIEAGRVTLLALGGVEDASVAGRLGGLEELRLEGSFAELELADLARLHRLEARSTGLRRVRLGALPSLEELFLDGGSAAASEETAQVDGLETLRDLPSLRQLSCDHCGLSSLPDLGTVRERLTDLSLRGNRLDGLAFLEGFSRLERLHLSSNQIRSLDDLPPLQSLLVLDVARNPLRPDTRLDASKVPELSQLDVAFTGLQRPPAGAEALDGLRVELDPGVAEANDFADTLARLRTQYEGDAAPERVEKLTGTAGEIRGSSGRCTWKTSTFSAAQVTCDFTFDLIRGTASARLGETDLAMLFQGGGHPKVQATLTVGEGLAAVYARNAYDLVATARLVTDVDEETAEALRQPGDRFDGYHRAVARPGQPAVVRGEPSLLGSRVVLWVEAVGEDGRSLGAEAKDVRLVVEPL